MPMTMIDKASVLRRLLGALVRGDSETIGELVTDDVLAWSPSIFAESRDDLIGEASERQEALSNIEVDVGIVHVVDGSAIAEWHVSADHTGPLSVDDDLIIEATGRRLHLSGATFAEFRDDKVCAVRSYFDDLALLEQALVDA
jgi:ketosteroid isomerase-like protein